MENLTPTPIDTRVPLTLHPDMLTMPHRKVLDVENSPGATVLGVGAEAMGVLYSALSRLQTAKTALQATAPYSVAPGEASVPFRHAPPTPRVNELRAAAEDAFNDAAKTHDSAVKKIAGIVADMGKQVEIQCAPDDVESARSIALDQEIRNHVKSLPTDQRRDFMLAAVKNNDKRTVFAVANSLHYLSGLDEKQHGMVVDAARSQFAPFVHSQMKASQAVLNQLTNAGKLFGDSYMDALPKAPKKVEKADTALAALRKGSK